MTNNNSEIQLLFDKLKDHMPNFEYRKNQIALISLIWNCLNKNEYCIVEAPTGVGKTLSYLIPLILYVKKYKKRAVVSTNTINLQHQILNKDLPILKNFLDFTVKVALGRTNYICLRKLYIYISKIEGNLFDSHNEYLYNLKELLRHPSGLKSEVITNQNMYSEELWNTISSNVNTCIKSKCPYFKICFYYKAKRELGSADIIVANHHIILSDMSLETDNQLGFDTLIFDEAHNIEKNATLYFTETLSSFETLSTIDQLIEKNTETKKLYKNDYDEYKHILETNKDIINTVFNDIINMVFQKEEKNLDKKELKSITPLLKSIQIAMGDIIRFTTYISDKINDVLLKTEINIGLEKLYKIDNTINNITKIRDDTIYWGRRFQNHIHINLTPINISETLKSQLYTKLNNLIVISATLSIRKDFTFIKHSLGLDDAKSFIFENEFDYKHNAKLLMISDISDPNDNNFVKDLATTILKAAQSLDENRGIIILFTSYNLLNIIYSIIKKQLKEFGFSILRQGDFDRFEMLEKFKKKRSILLGTNSFWEGIDVKGEKLSLVFITKLPFDVPESPIEKARYNIIKQNGGNGFLEYAIPKAVIRFKQGCGRLIRSYEDKGIIIISDSRIVSKYYGKFFLESLPSIPIEVIKKDETFKTVNTFFNNN